jgi:hypothetical protein
MVILLYKWLVVLCAWLPLGSGEQETVTTSARHPLYISVTEMNYNATDKNLEISCKIFADDFEKALASVNHTKVDLSAPADKAAADKMVAAYVKDHFQLKLDNKPVTLEFVGYEKESDAIWSYFQVPHTTTAPKKIDIVNSILYESSDKQINLMHASVAGNRKSTRLNYPDKEASFNF